MHQQGAWRRECFCLEMACQSEVPFGDVAPLLRQLWGKELHPTVTRAELADQLADLKWWAVPDGGKLLTTAAKVGGGPGYGCLCLWFLPRFGMSLATATGIKASKRGDLLLAWCLHIQLPMPHASAPMPQLHCFVKPMMPLRPLLLTALQASGLGPTNWASYFEQRPLPPTSLLPMLLDTPLSLLWAVQRLQQQRGQDAAPEQLTIHLVGAEKELDQWPVLLELGALLPSTTIDLHLVGPEMPDWADGRSVSVPSPPPAAAGDSEGGSSGGSSRDSSSSINIHFHSGMYGELAAPSAGSVGSSSEPGSIGSAPDLVVAPNAGLGAYMSWIPALMHIADGMAGPAGKPELFLFTDYIEESVHIGRKNVGSVLGRGARLGGALAQSERIELNPFRKPCLQRKKCDALPHFANGFASWLSRAAAA